MKQLIPTIVLLCMLSSMHAQIERDKVLHFVGGGLFGLAGAGIAKQATDGNRAWTFVGSVVGSTLAGVAKESIDAGQSDNSWDNEDLVATILGGVTVGITIELFSKKRKDGRLRGSLTADRTDLDKTINIHQLSFLNQETGKLPVLTPLGFSNDINQEDLVQDYH
nr:hypothetical protein [Allomuricauda sp.]